jgi:cell division protein FtsI/penicillin-binding protein 2
LKRLGLIGRLRKLLFPKRSNNHTYEQRNIPFLAGQVLNIILLAFVLIGVKVWLLTVVQHEKRVEIARRPQKKRVVERAFRASIRDRFNIPLAMNRMQYNASILYSDILDIPRIVWKTDDQGERYKIFKRVRHVEELSKLLAQELNLTPQRVEDMIYSKAAIFPNVPFTIKANIDEETYFRFKMLEKDWPGIFAQAVPRRVYPQGKVASDIIGYMGAIDSKTYHDFIEEMSKLREFLKHYQTEGEFYQLPEGFQSVRDVRYRLEELEEKAYSFKDIVGRAGLERVFEEKLRGFYGSKSYQVDAKGNLIRQLPGGREPVSGQRVLLTISSELQEFAERLLAQNEISREGTSRRYNKKTRAWEVLKQPWIKGGSIVAMDPKTGEILAMASHPRFDPNDFIPNPKKEYEEQRIKNIHRWLETQTHIASIWDQQVPFSRDIEYYDHPYIIEEKEIMTWKRYLQAILPYDSLVIKSLEKIKTISSAIDLQNAFEKILSLYESGVDPKRVMNLLYPPFKGHQAYGNLKKYEKDVKDLDDNISNDKENQKAKAILDSFLEDLNLNYDKLLVVDLCKIVVSPQMLSKELLNKKGKQSLAVYRQACASKQSIRKFVYEKSKILFGEIHFSKWREKYEKSFIKQKRREERERGTYARPYLDYFDKKQRELFTAFWEYYEYPLTMSLLMGGSQLDKSDFGIISEYTDYFSSWHKELEQGAHQSMSWRDDYFRLRQAISSLPSELSKEYFNSLRGFKDLVLPLYGRYKNVGNEEGVQLESHLASGFYPLSGFGYSRSFSYSHAASLGSIFKVVTAYAALQQQHDEYKASNKSLKNLNPLTITDVVKRNRDVRPASWIVGYTSQGDPIPLIYKGGRILKSLRRNIGKIDITDAIAYSSNTYFCLLAGDYLKDPNALNDAARELGFGEKTGLPLAGEYKGNLPDDLEENPSGLYSYSCGQHTLVATPIQTAIMLGALANGGEVLHPLLIKYIAGSEPVRGGAKIFRKDNFSYQHFLNRVGVNYPLFLEAEKRLQKQEVTTFSPSVRRLIPLPEPVKSQLLRGMHKGAVEREESSFHNYYDYPKYVRDYQSMKKDIAAKTATAERLEGVDVDYFKGVNLYNHIWFGLITYPSSKLPIEEREADLVVVVYLRFGNYGKEAAPLATQMARKWREIKEKNTIN